MKGEVAAAAVLQYNQGVSQRGCRRSTLEPERSGDVFFWSGHMQHLSTTLCRRNAFFYLCVLAQEIKITTMGTSCRWKARSPFEMCRKEIYWHSGGGISSSTLLLRWLAVCASARLFGQYFFGRAVHEMKIMMLREAEGVAGLCS